MIAFSSYSPKEMTDFYSGGSARAADVLIEFLPITLRSTTPNRYPCLSCSETPALSKAVLSRLSPRLRISLHTNPFHNWFAAAPPVSV
jgi:hypothetical protein